MHDHEGHRGSDAAQRLGSHIVEESLAVHSLEARADEVRGRDAQRERRVQVPVGNTLHRVASCGVAHAGDECELEASGGGSLWVPRGLHGHHAHHDKSRGRREDCLPADEGGPTVAILGVRAHVDDPVFIEHRISRAVKHADRQRRADRRAALRQYEGGPLGDQAPWPAAEEHRERYGRVEVGSRDAPEGVGEGQHRRTGGPGHRGGAVSVRRLCADRGRAPGRVAVDVRHMNQDGLGRVALRLAHRGMLRSHLLVHSGENERERHHVRAQELREPARGHLHRVVLVHVRLRDLGAWAALRVGGRAALVLGPAPCATERERSEGALATEPVDDIFDNLLELLRTHHEIEDYGGIGRQ
mmetsp:Transcript_76786/g.203785  ORF Transcript_76786/g.203785 Transcript_76786/m.203785 type:complete len:357 (+) Transcript_76786:155-1225(+)